MVHCDLRGVTNPVEHCRSGLAPANDEAAPATRLAAHYAAFANGPSVERPPLLVVCT
jgi:hypothetical protein